MLQRLSLSSAAVPKAYLTSNPHRRTGEKCLFLCCAIFGTVPYGWFHSYA